ncbi:hypothetical protein P8452_66879 [Trifolium repens]|nr:hypothetical protein P8452_66879 [Trifolium repens]
MVKSPSQTPPTSPPPSPPSSPQPKPPQFRHSQSATDIVRLMTKDLRRPISPLHSSYLELSEKSPPAVTVHPPPPQSLLHPSLSATDIVDKMTQELSEESPPAVNVHPPPPSPPSGQLPPPENWSPEEERLFHQGAKACGKDWELISADYVKTKTPIQICEYAKKIQLCEKKNKTT